MPEDLDDDGFDDYADDDSKQYLYMELESTSNYKDFDIDKMLESASLEQFTKQIYSSGASKKIAELTKQGQVGKQSGLELIQSMIESSDAADQEELGKELPSLKFDEDAEDGEQTQSTE